MTLPSPISKLIAVYCSNSDVLTLSAQFESCLQCCHWPQNNAMDPQVRFRPSKSDNALLSIFAVIRLFEGKSLVLVEDTVAGEWVD